MKKGILTVGGGVPFSGHYKGIPGSYMADPVDSDGIAWEDSTLENGVQEPKDMRTTAINGCTTEAQTDHLYSTDFAQGAKMTFGADGTQEAGWNEWFFPNPVKINKSLTGIVYNETELTTQVSLQQHVLRVASTGNHSVSGRASLYTQWYEQGWTHLTIGTADLDVDMSDTEILATSILIKNDSAQARVQYVGGLVFNARSRPQLIIQWDDAFEGVHTVGAVDSGNSAREIITAAGLKAVVGVTLAEVDTAGFCTLAELQELETTYGWDMVPHGALGHAGGALNDDLALIQAAVEAEQAYLVANFNSPHPELYIYPGGSVGTNSKQALINTGVTYARTTTAGVTSTALGVPQPYYLRSRTIAESTKTQLLADIDLAINAGGTMIHYGHDVVASGAAGSLEINTADLQTYITGVKARVDAGLLDVVLWSDWVAGLPD